MKILKKIIGICIVLIIVGNLIAISYLKENWMFRFKSDLDRFFGEGNWECASVDRKTYRLDSDEKLITYKNWFVSYNEDNEESTFKISNLNYEINSEKYLIISSKRLSAKEAFYWELMEVSFDIAGEKVIDEFIRSELSEKEADCIDAYVSYTGGRPKIKFFNYLSKQDWFTADRVTAGDYLTCDEHDFYIKIRVVDYKLKKLTEEERQNIFNSLEVIEEKLLKKYGDDATFSIYFDDEHQVEFIKGRKQKK